MFEYQARCVEVVDGDTMDVEVDLGFNMYRRIRLRLDGVDTHETYGVDKDSEEYQRGKEEERFVRRWLEDASDEEWPLIVTTRKKGKYGRYIAGITRRNDGDILNESLKTEFSGITN